MAREKVTGSLARPTEPKGPAVCTWKERDSLVGGTGATEGARRLMGGWHGATQIEPKKAHGAHWDTFRGPLGKEINPEVRKREEPEGVPGAWNVTGFNLELTDTLHYWIKPIYK